MAHPQRHCKLRGAPVALALLGAMTVVPGAAAQGPSTGGLVLERVHSGFVVSPVAKLTKVDGDIGTLAGVYGGWLTDRRLLIGAGAHWLVGGADNVDMAYGGGVVEWFTNPHALVSGSISGLAGFGTASLTTALGGAVRRLPPRSFGRFDHHRGFIPATAVRVWENFLVAEPQASLVLSATDWLRIGLGAGYRLVGGAGAFDGRLRGFTGSIGVQLGPP